MLPCLHATLPACRDVFPLPALLSLCHVGFRGAWSPPNPPLSALSPFPLFPCSPSHHSVPATTTAAPLAATAGAHLSAQTQLWRGSAICGMSQAPTLIWPIRTVSRLNRCFYYHTIIDRVAYLIIRLLDHDG